MFVQEVIPAMRISPSFINPARQIDFFSYPPSFLDLVNKLGISKFSYYWIILFSTSFISGFITAFLIHLFLKIIGGKGTYADTYKIYAYSALILSLNVVSQFLFSFPAFQMVISLSLIVWFILVLKNGLRVVHW